MCKTKNAKNITSEKLLGYKDLNLKYTQHDSGKNMGWVPPGTPISVGTKKRKIKKCVMDVYPLPAKSPCEMKLS